MLCLGQVIVKARSKYINVADKLCEFNDSFMLYMTTRLPNPHLSPENQAKVRTNNLVYIVWGICTIFDAGLFLFYRHLLLPKNKNSFVASLGCEQKLVIWLFHLNATTYFPSCRST